MSTAEYENTMSDIQLTQTQEKMDAFAKLHDQAKKIHTAEISELERFKSIMDKLNNIEQDLSMIKRHFGIVRIIN